MPTIFDVEKKPIKTGKTIFDFKEDKVKGGSIFDVEPKRKERKPTEISQPLITKQQGDELRGRLFPKITKEPELMWTYPKAKEPRITRPEVIPDVIRELTPNEEIQLSTSYSAWAEREFQKQYPGAYKAKRGERNIMWMASLVALNRIVPSVLGQAATKIPAFGAWVSRHHNLAPLLAKAIEGGIASLATKETGAPATKEMLEGAAINTTWFLATHFAASLPKLLKGKIPTGIPKARPIRPMLPAPGKVTPTTAVPPIHQVIKKVADPNIRYMGVQRVAKGKGEDIVLLYDKTVGDEIAIPKSKFTVENVQQKLIKKRERLAIPEATPPVAPLIEEPELVPNGAGISTIQQKAQAHILAKKILWVSEKGKTKPSYRRFAMAMTGKRSIKDMTKEEADYFIDSLKRLKLRPGGRPPRIPTTAFMITKDFADKIPVLGEIGAVERVRETKRVFAKMGLEKEIWVPAFETEVKAFEEQQAFRQVLSAHREAVEKAGGTPQRVFRLLEDTATKEEKRLATPEEHRAAEWLKKHYDSWADKLKIPAEKRRRNYITHIFEKEIVEAYREKRPIDPDLIKALDFITPKTIFMPYLRERLGQNIGLKEDAWAAASAYEARALKVFHYEPLIKRIRIYEKFLPPNAAKYLRSFITRITSRPLVIDRELKQNLTEMANVIEKLPHGDVIANYLKRGNPAALLSYNMTGILYEAFLGFRPLSAIKNLSQKTLTIAECGIVNFAKARVWKHTAEGRKVLKESLILRSRKLGYLPGVDETFIAKLDSKRRRVSMYMFRLADKDNVTDGFATGYLEAKGLGLPHELAIKRGDEVAHKTQYLYTKLAGSQFMQTSPGRVLGVLTTWPRNWVELVLDWTKGKPSQVYSDYQKATGKRILPEGLLAKRKALLRYLAIVAAAMYIQKKTRFKALYYTGWTSLASFARMAKGEFAGLDIPGSVAMLVAGTMTADQSMIKKAWGRLRPDRLVIITRELSDILMGKKDWLSLFFIMEREKGGSKFQKMRETRKLRK